MKRTSRQGEINYNKQIRCEFPSRRSGGHRVRELNDERNYNQQTFNNFEILHK